MLRARNARTACKPENQAPELKFLIAAPPPPAQAVSSCELLEQSLELKVRLRDAGFEALNRSSLDLPRPMI